VPILRNSYVYFEMSVLPRPAENHLALSSMVTLSIGLATKEMPSNMLVGSWQGSIGLCSTGQILASGQWFTPLDPSMSVFGEGGTVGCLAFLDEDSAFETWDGVMVTTRVVLSANGSVIIPAIPPSVPAVAPGIASPHVSMFPTAPAHESHNSSSCLPLLVPSVEDLFPTVTLHSAATAVMCRFSAEDIVAVDRASIGAPEGVTVYAADGSIVFDHTD
jgi:hypothetical protein